MGGRCIYISRTRAIFQARFGDTLESLDMFGLHNHTEFLTDLYLEIEIYRNSESLAALEHGYV